MRHTSKNAARADDEIVCTAARLLPRLPLLLPHAGHAPRASAFAAAAWMPGDGILMPCIGRRQEGRRLRRMARQLIRCGAPPAARRALQEEAANITLPAAASPPRQSPLRDDGRRVSRAALAVPTPTLRLLGRFYYTRPTQPRLMIARSGAPRSSVRR